MEKVISYLIQIGFLPKIYENIEEVKKEFNPTHLRLKVLSGGYYTTWVRQDNRWSKEEEVSSTYTPPKYHTKHSYFLAIFTRIVIVLIVLFTIYGVITNGIISKNIIASILLCLAFFVLECNVKYSLIILALVGGMPLLVIIYLLFTGKYTELSEFGSMSYYGLGFIGNLMILAYSILIFKDKNDISIVIIDEKKGVYVKYSQKLMSEFKNY